MKENLQRELERDPTDAELGEAMNMSVLQVKRHMEVGHAARDKLIMVNSAFFNSFSMLFVITKH